MKSVKVINSQVEDSFYNGYFISTLKGLVFTFRILFRQLLGLEKNNALEYPEKKHQYSPRFKGKHYLTKRPDGKVRCTACMLCATNCPAQCITIEAAPSDDINIEKYPIRFEIDILRCVFCGYCVEACPVDAIRMGGEYSMAGLAEDKWVYTIEDLLNRPELDSLGEETRQSVKIENEKMLLGKD